MFRQSAFRLFYPPNRLSEQSVSSAGLRETHKPGFAIKGEAGQVQGAPCRGSRVAQTLAGRDQSEDLRARKEARRGGEKGSAKPPASQGCTRFVAISGLCGKQPSGVERRESHRIKERVVSVADDERSNSRYIVPHTVYRPSEDGTAVRSRCRVGDPAARGPGGAEHPGHQRA